MSHRSPTRQRGNRLTRPRKLIPRLRFGLQPPRLRFRLQLLAADVSATREPPPLAVGPIIAATPDFRTQTGKENRCLKQMRVAFSRRPDMKTSTRNEPNDRESQAGSSNRGGYGKGPHGDPLPLVPGNDRAGEQLPSDRGHLPSLRSEVRLRSAAGALAGARAAFGLLRRCARPSAALERCITSGITPTCSPPSKLGNRGRTTWPGPAVWPSPWLRPSRFTAAGFTGCWRGEHGARCRTTIAEISLAQRSGLSSFDPVCGVSTVPNCRAVRLLGCDSAQAINLPVQRQRAKYPKFSPPKSVVSPRG